MIPIPRSILVHTATLQNATGDRNQNRTYTTVAALSRIRVELANQQMINKDGKQVQLSGRLFFDAHNSLPKDTAFSVGQYVLFNSVEYRVESVEPLFDKRKLHHYEVGLSG